MVIFCPRSIPFAAIALFASSPITSWKGGSRSFLMGASPSSDPAGFLLVDFAGPRRRPFRGPFLSGAASSSVIASSLLSSSETFPSLPSFRGRRLRSRLGGLIAPPPGLVTLTAFNFPVSSFSSSNSTSDPSTYKQTKKIVR